jgi:hypothetical protein
LGVGFSTSANATLINNGGGLIYDTGLNVTFYDYRYTGPPTANGTTLAQALAWANGLTAGGVSGWRLPTTNVLALGYNYGEMGELYHVEFGLNGATVTVSNQFPFTTLLPNFYWTSTAATASGTNAYYDFEFDVGRQWADFSTVQLYALAVHDGDVGGSPTATPEPATMLLLGLGLIGMAGVRRFK